MIPFIVLGAVLLTGAGAVAIISFWDKIKDFLKKAYEKIKKVVQGTIIGVATYLQSYSISDGIKAFQKFYSKKSNGKYVETTVERELDECDLPPEILAKLKKANGNQVDISKELEMELS